VEQQKKNQKRIPKVKGGEKKEWWGNPTKQAVSSITSRFHQREKERGGMGQERDNNQERKKITKKNKCSKKKINTENQI